MMQSEETLNPEAGKPQVAPAGPARARVLCDFSHVGNFTAYMEVVLKILEREPSPVKVLDMPAGNGLLADQLKARGHQVTCADINRERPDYILADMNERLPFADAEFDVVLCLEGLEHTLHPSQLIGELCRITRKGGRIILSLPNIQSVFSRLKFLCTGFFYQFSPWGSFARARSEKKDRGHISSLTYLQLRYLFGYNGASVALVRGDRWKKKWLIPVLLPLVGAGWIWARVELAQQPPALAEEGRATLRDLFSAPALFSRSLVLVFRKN